MLLPVGVIAPQGKDFPGLVGLRADMPRRNFSSATAGENKSGIEPASTTFGAGTTPWIAPDATFKVESMTGRGGSGTPFQSGSPYYTYTYSIVYFDAQGGITGTDGSSTEAYGGEGTAPADGCTTSDTGNGTSSRYCTSYYQRYHADTPATTGQDGVYFGEIFPGGPGGTATTYAVTNTPIQPGATYNIFVPSGGTLTIFYCK